MDANMASEARNNALWRKPAVICENKRHSIGYPHIFDHARLIADAADIARRRPTTGIQNGGLYTGSTLYLCNGMRYQRNSNGYPHIFDHGRLIADTGDIARRRPTETVGISLISHSIAEIQCTSGLVRHFEFRVSTTCCKIQLPHKLAILVVQNMFTF